MSYICNHFKSILNNNYRVIHTTSIYNAENRVMNKIISGNSKKRRYVEGSPVPIGSSFSKGANEGKKSENSKGVTVLNKLFMRHITDLMATGANSSIIVGHGIEINRVKVTPDFQTVNVFWLARGTENDKIIESLLQDNAAGIRHELSQLRVMGVVPKIRFVKDKQFAQLMEIDLRLAKADFGDDYVESEAASKLKNELQLHTSLEPNIKKIIEELDAAVLTEELEEPLPPMPQNVLGLNHYDILDKIKKANKKSVAIHRIKSNDNQIDTENVEHIENLDPVTFPSMKTQRDKFKEFLNKRQLLKVKVNKEFKNYRPELDYIEEEWEIKFQNKNMHFEEYLDDKDYITDVDGETNKQLSK